MKIQAFFKKAFPNSNLLFTDRARSALQAIIQDLNLTNSKIIIPSFICSDIFSELLISNNIEPILIDCPKDNFNIKFSDIKKAYKKETKSVLVTHTFGAVNQEIKEIAEWCKKKNIILIEDCAHTINTKLNGKLLGEFGDASVFSFPKTLGTLLGGVYVKNSEKINITSRPCKVNKSDLLFCFLKKHSLGRTLIKILRSFKLNKAVNLDLGKIEICSPPFFFDKLSISNNTININKRKQVAKTIHKELSKQITIPKLQTENNFFYSIPILVENRDKVFNDILNKNINCNKMWDAPLSMDKVLSEKYKLNKTPNAENFSKKIINILINPNLNKKQLNKQIKTILSILRYYS